MAAAPKFCRRSRTRRHNIGLVARRGGFWHLRQLRRLRQNRQLQWCGKLLWVRLRLVLLPKCASFAAQADCQRHCTQSANTAQREHKPKRIVDARLLQQRDPKDAYQVADQERHALERTHRPHGFSDLSWRRHERHNGRCRRHRAHRHRNTHSDHERVPQLLHQNHHWWPHQHHRSKYARPHEDRIRGMTGGHPTQKQATNSEGELKSEGQMKQ
mmetsp:Transcript_3626/g.10898  ORF Transcript_3626/g.10898 Transcript_3626/m.10898 type:complete len:214 (+) Transcript_3626:430-1071(+)